MQRRDPRRRAVARRGLVGFIAGEEEEEEALPVAVLLEIELGEAADGGLGLEEAANRNNIPRRAVATAQLSSPFLFNYIQENALVCNQRIPEAPGCHHVTKRCQDNPEEVYFRCRDSGRGVLHEACLRCSCTHVIDAILAVNADLTMMTDNNSDTPLHLLFKGLDSTHATISAQDVSQIVEKLLQPQPELVASIRNREGRSALHLMCNADDEMVPLASVRTLLDAFPDAASIQDEQGQYPLHLYCKQPNASAQVAQLLMQENPDTVIQRLDQTSASWAPLHYACAQSPPNFELIKAMCDLSVAALRLRSEVGETPLHVLCRQRLSAQNVDVLQLLLEAAPAIACWKSTRGSYTPLHLLCRKKLVPVELIQTYAFKCPQALSVADEDQFLPIHHCCEVGADFPVVDLLLNIAPDRAKTLTRKKDTPLHLAAAANCSFQTIQRLLECFPGATSSSNAYGFVPLHCASRALYPSPEIIGLLLGADPSSARALTNSNETAIHLASSNPRTSVAVLNMLTKQDSQQAPTPTVTTAAWKSGNSPLHVACLHGASVDKISFLAEQQPSSVAMKNASGFTPLQLLCKSGRIEERLIALFHRIGGVSIFQTVDSAGNTPLHSAMRKETDSDALLQLMKIHKGALLRKTVFNDLPIHFAILRRMDGRVVQEVALATCRAIDLGSQKSGSSISPLLTVNKAFQTPVEIAAEEFQKSLGGQANCFQTKLDEAQSNIFKSLSSLLKIIHYGADPNSESKSLLGACVAIHRKNNIWLDPAIIRRAISDSPKEARQKVLEGFPLHIEAGIPMEKMQLLNGCNSSCNCCAEGCHCRSGVLRALLDAYPEAAKHRSEETSEYPLGLMAQNGRPWDSTFAMVLRLHPHAVHYIRGVTSTLVPQILENIDRDCGRDTLFSLIQSKPDFLSFSPRENIKN